jgi:DNA adenine methylase
MAGLILELNKKYLNKSDDDKDNISKKTGGSIIGRMGGKKLLKETIVNKFPKDYQNMTYVEPFVGGGSIFFKKDKSVKDVINDLDSNVIDVYKGFQKYDFEKIKKDVNGSYTKEDFIKIKNSNPKNPYDKFIRNFILFRISFYANQSSFGRGSINLKHNFGDDLKNVIILNTDYKNLIKKYDSKNTFFYLDPPYEGSGKQHYKHSDIDYEELKNLLENIKGKFLLSINQSKNIKELFNNFNIAKVKTKYTNPLTGGQSIDKTELLISNY